MSSLAYSCLRCHQEMPTFSSSIVSQYIWTRNYFRLRRTLPVGSYSSILINALVSFGLLLLYMPSYRIWDWNPPFRVPKIIISIYFLSNLFLVVVPFFPPASGTSTYEKLPYWVCYFLLMQFTEMIDSRFCL